MQNRRKTLTSFLAGLLAILTLLPMQEVEAAYGDNTYTDDSVVQWGTDLPKDGTDFDYRSNEGWHRLVLEYGDYCTNAVDSSGNYANILSNKTSSWPEYAWHNTKQQEKTGTYTPSNWPGKTKTEWMKAGTLQRAEDYDLYRNGEYSEDGLYSLWIKYAGTCQNSSNKGQDCWYISPCDENGNRAYKLWALDCCLDVTYPDIDDNPFEEYFLKCYPDAYSQYVTGSKPVMLGIEPTFNLLTPTFEEFEKLDNFKYAGVSIPFFYRNAGFLYIHDIICDQVENNGAIRCDYIDNEKWIIKQNEDGSWAIQSAGYIDWDWMDMNGDFCKLYEDPASYMANGLSVYIKAVAYGQVRGNRSREGAGRTSTGKEYATILMGYLCPWATNTWYALFESKSPCCSFAYYAYMVFLSDYAENVYISASYKYSGTTGFNTPQTATSLPNGELSASYGMKFVNTVTKEMYDNWLDKDKETTDREYIAYGGYDYWNYSIYTTPERQGVSVKNEVASITGESTSSYKTIDEIIETLPIYVEPNWAPSKGQGAFDAIYIGDCLEMNTVLENGGSLTVDRDSTVVLGTADKNDDGYCEASSYIGTTVKNAIKLNRLSAYKAPNITVEDGGFLQIDGPTYAAAGTTITVKGSLDISAGAYLSAESIKSATPDAYRNGLNLIIDGGTVTINSSSMLDLGFGSMVIKNCGTLVNNGVFIQAAENDRGELKNTTMQGGTVENGDSGWMIIGAEVYHNTRLRMMRGLTDSTTLAQLSLYICNIRDNALAKYTQASSDTARNSYAGLYLDGSDHTNLLLSSGNILVTGAIKGNDSDVDKIRSGGNIYSGLDILKNSVSFKGSSFSNHTSIASQHNSKVTEDSVILEYYKQTNIDFKNETCLSNDQQDTVASKNNIMALRVGTGSQGTSGIGNFRITYVDTDKTVRTQVIDVGSLDKTYKRVCETTYCGKTENQKGDSKLKTHGTTGVLSKQSFATTLEPVSNVVYIFQTSYPLAYVKSISFMGSGTGAWTCTELSVYRVYYLYPIEEYGWCSEDWYVPFDGELIAETAMQPDADGIKSINFRWDSNLVEIGTGLYQLNAYNVPDKIRSESDKTGFTYFRASREYKPYSVQMDNYTFSVTLADAENAGFESLYNVGTDVNFNKYLTDAAWQKTLEQEVKLDMTFTYVDTQGSARRVTVPYTQSAIEWAYANMNAASKKEPIHGLFQQGEEISFRAPLPDFARLIDTSITYTDKEDGATISVAAASLNKTDYTNAAVKDGVLTISAPESALYYFCAADTKGLKLDNRHTMTLNMKEWTGKESLTPTSKSSKYLIIVETDSMISAGTTKDLYVSFTYESVTGASFSTPSYALRSAVNDYYGYWLSSAGEETDCAYRVAVSPGGQIYFVLNLSNVYKFTSATFTMPANGETVVTDINEEVTEITNDTPNNANAQEAGENADNAADSEGENETEAEQDITTQDSWQMKAITVYELEELGPRRVVLGSGSTASGVTTNRTYYRDNAFSSRGAISRVKSALLLSPGQTKKVSFDGTVTGGGTSTNKITDIERLRYEDTKKDYGFNTRRVKYAISVFVDGKSVTSAEDGDCGSKNQFYFQLVFQDEDGKLRTSPYVLANQQLQSDGFRTGTEETFNIYTNDDYGTPVQINIIPDDTSSASDVFDKLCVDHISVSRTSGTGVNLNWKTGEVGWIDIEYKEDAEDQNGRTNEELIRSFQLQDDGYKVWIEFAIETDATYYNSRQFVGQVLADITYRDTSGAVQVKNNVTVVSDIADYAERKSELADATEKGTEVSMPSFMFRNGYTNRFLAKFEDISSLISIKFRISSTEAASGWTINNVSARQVYDEGTLTMNIFNEYEHVYSVEPQDLTSTSNSKPVTIAATGTKNSGTLNFTSGNSIVINLEEGEEEIEVKAGESAGANDKISMTVELEDTTGIAAGTTMSARVVYKNIYGDAFEVKTELFFDAESQKFMIPVDNLPHTADIGVPYQVEITGGNAAGKMLTAVKVYQIRDSAAEETFLFVPENAIALKQTEAVTLVLSESEQDAYAKRRGYTQESQEVYLKLGTLTNRILLTETQDLQLALVYTEKDDPYAYEHTSDFISVLDNGYTVLKSGDALRIPMSVSNIGSVRAIRFIASASNVKINVDRACICVEETSNMSGALLYYGWANLPEATGLISTDGTDMKTDGSSLEKALTSATRITPIGVDAELTAIARSDAIVKVTVTYTTAAEEICAETFEKSASEWNKGGAWALIDGVSGVALYKIEVYDTDPAFTTSVTVGNIDINWYNSEGKLTTANVSESTVITEGTVVTNALMNTNITGTVAASNGTKINLADNIVTEGRTEYQSITIAGGETVQISSRLPGFDGELEMSCDVRLVGFNGNVGTVESVSANVNSDTLNYTLSTEFSDYSDNLIYDFTIRSKNFSDNFAAKFTVVVEPTPYIEVILPADSLSDEPTTDTATGVKKGFINKFNWIMDEDNVIEIYAKAVNHPNGLRLTFYSMVGEFCSVEETENIVLDGYVGTWTKYTIHISPELVKQQLNGQIAIIKISLKGKTNVSYAAVVVGFKM